MNAKKRKSDFGLKSTAGASSRFALSSQRVMSRSCLTCKARLPSDSATDHEMKQAATKSQSCCSGGWRRRGNVFPPSLEERRGDEAVKRRKRQSAQDRRSSLGIAMNSGEERRPSAVRLLLPWEAAAFQLREAREHIVKLKRLDATERQRERERGSNEKRAKKKKD